ncbi:alpha-L-rhamnosidase [Microbacterium sp. BH-3-3-3]|uniref:alpha-L-rhamnosidase n=1 Tax=Microbacterium sp. BH-3-3-3 TaxID=1906742 RepID=UPI0008929F95|nr:alpha-L-rhamnosidase [Microbacterium sp. BH-3-3-3]AOX45873.1 hypothetical protein BJP65_08670 [Microbacterium sp. BH-3-3-3]
MITALRLRAEYRTDSPWVAVARPRLSWIAETDDPDWAQSAAEITLDDGRSTVVEGADHVFVAWPFASLAPREEVTARVRLRDALGAWSEPSDPCRIRLGSVPAEDWRARLIGLAEPTDAAQPFIVRRTITVDRPLASATLYWTALGAATVRIDGRPIDDTVLSPGWTSYADRLVHESVEVTSRLAPGDHVLGAEVTGAWYTESYGFGEEARRVYGDQPSVALQLHLLYEDGTEETIASTPEWEAAASPEVIASGLYEGETIVHSAAGPWWADSSQWPSAREASEQPVPVARFSEPVRRIEELQVVEVLTTPSGRTVLDFGQNLVGRLRLDVEGPAGTTIIARHAEVLEDGELAVRPLRRATSTDTFVLSGEGRESFEPAGTFHGFRYAEITGWPGAMDPDRIRAVVIHSDMRRTGSFRTSHPLLQRLHENVVWSMRGNFLALPTDCPQRDERLGWTGDAQIFAPTASTLYDCNGFLAHWLVDLRACQARSSGVVPTLVPNVFGFAWPAAGWGDAATVVPSVLADRFDDDQLLHDSVDSMTAWVQVELEAAGGAGLWESTLQFGDWLDPAAPADMAGAAKTSPGIVATAYLFRSLTLLAEAAARADRIEDAAWAWERAAEVREAFLEAYVAPSGRMVSDAPTAYALALRFGIAVDPGTRAALAARLAEVTRRDAFHISTGFIGTPLVLDALSDFGYDAEASALLLQTRVPSWLYPVTMGATTVWERWDSMLPDGTVNPGEMTSFNHYALGAVVDWLYRRVAGLEPIERGYARVRFAPIALPGLDDAAVELDTPAGRYSASWRRHDGRIDWTLTVPAHGRADVVLPGLASTEAGSGHHAWSTANPAPNPGSALSLWSPVAEIVLSPPAYRAVMEALESSDPGLADLVRRRTDWTLRTPLAAALFSVPASVVDTVGAVLDALGPPAPAASVQEDDH